jgi:hypothetical protein
VHLKEIIAASFPVHDLGWLISGHAFDTAYIPFGFGQLLFAGRAGPSELPEGNATVTAAFTPIT